MGFPSTRHLLASGITSTELVELYALELIEPCVEDRIDAGFAQLMALVYNRTRGKTDTAIHARDLVPKWGPVDHDELERKLRAGLNVIREMG